jgi:hypothetical protein
MDHRPFRYQLAFSIGFAVTRSRDLLRRRFKEPIESAGSVPPRFCSRRCARAQQRTVREDQNRQHEAETGQRIDEVVPGQDWSERADHFWPPNQAEGTPSEMGALRPPALPWESA